MRVLLKDLKVGMRLAQDVLSAKTSRRLLSKGQKLTSLGIAIIAGRGDYEYLEIIEEEKKQTEIDVKQIVTSIPELFISPVQKQAYHNLYKAVDAFVQAENNYNWDLCRINVKKFLTQNYDRVDDFLFIVHSVPVMTFLTARIVGSILQTAILLKQVKTGTDDIYRVCQATIFAHFGLKTFGDNDEQHIKFGINLLKSLDPGVPEDVVEAVKQHHERLDGSGFPEGSSEVHLWAQVLGICDEYNQFVFHSIQEETFEERPYWFHKFEPEIIQLFSKSITDISTRCFTTEDGKIGKIIFARNAEKPIVMIESEKDFRGWKFSVLEKSSKEKNPNVP
jgi:Holliday junction resolvase-like predicted endonuclease